VVRNKDQQEGGKEDPRIQEGTHADEREENDNRNEGEDG
jgi:hypothetical protein